MQHNIVPPSGALAVPHVIVTETLAAHANIWPALAQSHRHHVYAFQCRDFLEVWLATIGLARGTRPLFVRVNDGNGDPLFLLPLGLETIGGIRQLGFLDGGVVDYNAPVLFAGAATLDAAAMAQLWRAIVAALPAFDVAIFTKMPATVGAMANPMLHLGARPDRQSAYFLNLINPSVAPQGKGRTGNALFKDSRRRRRRLEEQGQVCFKIAGTDQERTHFLAAMLRQKRRRYLESRGVDGFKRPGYLDYFDAMTERFGATGEVSLGALLFKGEPVAVHWGIVTSNRFYYLMPSFEAGDLAKYSPGSLLLEHLVEWCRDRSMAIFDFGVGDESFKLEVASDTVPLFRAEQSKTLAGRACLSSKTIREQLSDGPLGDRWRTLKRSWGTRLNGSAGGKDTDGEKG